MALCQSLVEIIGCNDFESAICVVVYWLVMTVVLLTCDRPCSSPRQAANAIWSENNAEESLSDLENESARNLRINISTGYEPEKFTTEEIATIPMMSPEEDTYQSNDDVQREFGEQDQQAPTCGRNERIWTNSGTRLARSRDDGYVTN